MDLKAKTKNKAFYITTAIDYVNSKPHIGTAYEKIGADVLARWYRLNNYDVHFQMGNDEHSINVWKSAKEKGLSSKDYCDQMRTQFESTWKALDISYDGFIQTSDAFHAKGVQALFQRVLDNNDIYQSNYEGWYCESCEAYLTDKDLIDGNCPHHNTPPKWLKEHNYFFALSKYTKPLIDHIKSHPEFIMPEVRRNEIMRFLEDGLQDISISRSSFDWGIPLPNDSSHIVYVWFDALINYITAIGYNTDMTKFDKYWPASMHVIGKDITRFHCIIWPAMLMSAGIPLPKTIFGHGFVYLKGERMSKSLGNIIDPMDITHKFGADPLRYYLMREGSFGRDSDFTWDHFMERYNGDLANGIGNLVSRTIGMATRYIDGRIRSVNTAPTQLSTAVNQLPQAIAAYLDHSSGDIEFHRALTCIWDIIALADKTINDEKPWGLAKEKRFSDIEQILAQLSGCIYVIAIMLWPFMPKTAQKIWDQMGFSVYGDINKQDITTLSAQLAYDIQVIKNDGIFPRIENDPQKTTALSAAEPKKATPLKETPMTDDNTQITINDVAKVELKTAEICEAVCVDGTDKLMQLQIKLGDESRQIIAGIAQHYTAEELIGKHIVVIANLKPAKLRGIESNGMLLAASDDDMISILTPLKPVKSGSKVK